MSIESLELTNFQRFKNLRLEFDSYITTIVGDTDSGKSTILRALRWLCLNRPDGDRFIQWGESTAVALVEFDEKDCVRRIRGKDENAYYCNEQKYKAFGRFEVPPDISKLLNVGPENFLPQFSDPFWLTKSGPDAGRELNRIVNLELIDRVMEDVAGRLRRQKILVNNSEERLKSLEFGGDKLSWVKQADEKLKRIEEMQNKAAAAEERRAKLTYLVSKIKEITWKKKRFDRLIQARKKLIAISEKALTKEAEVKQLRWLVEKIKTIEEKRCQLDLRIKEREELIRSTFKEGCPLCGTKIPSL